MDRIFFVAHYIRTGLDTNNVERYMVPQFAVCSYFRKSILKLINCLNFLVVLWCFVYTRCRFDANTGKVRGDKVV